MDRPPGEPVATAALTMDDPEEAIMAWSEVETTERYDEWERADGYATLRVREHPDGSYVVRLDRLEQAPDGRDYRRERVGDRERADELLTEWKRLFDLPEE